MESPQMRMLVPSCHAATTGGVRQFEIFGTAIFRHSPFFSEFPITTPSHHLLAVSNYHDPAPAARYHGSNFCTPIASHALEEGIQGLGAAIGMAMKCTIIPLDSNDHQLRTVDLMESSEGWAWAG